MFLSNWVQTNFRLVGRSYSKCLSNYSTFWAHNNVYKTDAFKPIKFENQCSTRSLSADKPRVVTSAQATMGSEEERQGFMSAVADIIRHFNESDEYSDIPEAMKHFTTAMEYNITTNNLKRVHAVINAYKTLEKPENITPEKLRLAHIVACCLEMHQSVFTMTDDIIDRGQNRRGRKCWHLKEEIGLTAINDAMTLMSSVYAVINKYFAHVRCRPALLEVIDNMMLKTAFGQTMDDISVQVGKTQLESFTPERYRTITKYKTNYWISQFPMSLALCLANIYEPEVHQDLHPIGVELGINYQAENDMMDCYGKHGIKVGTDIRVGKCTWLIVEALKRATPEQKKILKENYGKPVVECEQAVRNLYDEMDMLNSYYAYNKEHFEVTRLLIKKNLSGRVQRMMYELLENQYGMKCS